MRRPAEDCQRQGIAFLPLVVESMGGWHATAERQVKKLGSCLARHTAQSEGEAISQLCSVPNSSDEPIFEKRRAKDGHFFNKNTDVRRAKRRAKFKFCIKTARKFDSRHFNVADA